MREVEVEFLPVGVAIKVGDVILIGVDTEEKKESA